jgi:hypothetical protein
VLNNPHTGEKPLDLAIDEFFTGDVWIHYWGFEKALVGARPEPRALQRHAGGH